MIIRPNKKWIAGVCSGIAVHFDVPVWIVRLAWLLAVFTIIPFFFYFICAVSLPQEGAENSFYKPKILGVCFKLSQTSGMNLAILRIGTLSLMLMSFGMVCLIYFLLWVINRPITQS